MNATDKEKLNLIREAIDDCTRNELSEEAALFAIQIIMSPPPTEAEIQHAREVVAQHPEWA